VLLQKAKPAIWEGDRNPPGQELPSEDAERGNCPEAKPNREGRETKTCSRKTPRMVLAKRGDEVQWLAVDELSFGAASLCRNEQCTSGAAYREC
jgi:hypothetical protein